MRLWRISNFADLTGEGGLYRPGRWHRRGTLVVHLADHPSTALLETLVHMTRVTVPESYQLLEVDVPEEAGIAEAHPPTGREHDQETTRLIGERFFFEARDLLLRVQSAVMPRAWNFLLNPQHRESVHARIVSVERYPFDSRLFAYPDADN